ncbi:hypothetical protein [Megalodesulfovibrio paquesii]
MTAQHAPPTGGASTGGASGRGASGRGASGRRAPGRRAPGRPPSPWELSASSSDRVLIGLDARRREVDPEDVKEFAGFSVLHAFLTRRQTYPAIPDHGTWPKCKGLEQYEQWTNGLWFYDTDYLFAVAVALKEKGALIAVDIPTADAARYRKHHGVQPLALKHVADNPCWQFLGYDVADNWISHSAFWGFWWEEGELEATLTRHGVALNEFGLVDDAGKAAALAAYYSGEVKEHAPFVPCGVWVWDFELAGGPPELPWKPQQS